MFPMAKPNHTVLNGSCTGSQYSVCSSSHTFTTAITVHPSKTSSSKCLITNDLDYLKTLWATLGTKDLSLEQNSECTHGFY